MSLSVRSIDRLAIINILLFCLLLIIPASAQMTAVALDGDCAISGISPVTTSVISGEKLLISITAEQVENMHSYSIKVAFNPGIISFDGAVAKLSPMTPAFIESQQGKLAAFLAIPQKGIVEIAATQAGKDFTTSVSGNGILGYISFTAKTDGNPNISIIEARCVDPNGKITLAQINKP